MTEIVVDDPIAPAPLPTNSVEQREKIPKLRVPFAIVGSSAVVVEQDSPEEVQQCTVAVLRSTPGLRGDFPDMGLPDFAFAEGGADLPVIDSQLDTYEPRSALLSGKTLDGLIETVRLESNLNRRDFPDV